MQRKPLMRETASGSLVTVRAYRPEDVDRMFAAAAESVAELAPYETWCHPGYSRDDAAGYVGWCVDNWPPAKAFYFAVEDTATGEFLGSCGLSDLLVEHRRAGLGFWIRSSRTGRGFATQAAQLVGRLAFQDLGLERLELEIAVDNAASRRVAEKLGCRFEGVLHRRLVLPAGPTDTAMYCWLRS
ncbi:MAG: GNAT family N-acetyltransferase [Thermoleophilia bacterium]|nr:GNAT family N-acetyltransferase [Thermoleophilia bacterium]